MLGSVLKMGAHKAALMGESALARLLTKFGNKGKRLPVIEAYLGFATNEELVLRGRVLRNPRDLKPKLDQSRWRNFLKMVSLFVTDEVPGRLLRVKARGGEVMTRTDEEGYFRLSLPRAAYDAELAQRREDSGWVEVWVEDADVAADVGEKRAQSVRGHGAECRVFLRDGTARLGVISDIDDTVLKTGAWSLVKNLWTSLTGNVLTREIYEDARLLLERLHGGENPVFYVSSSPWNMYAFLEEVLFVRGGLVRGAMFLRDLGLSQDQFFTGTHGDHKGGAIQGILDANPQVCFVLMGDLGQEDALIYKDIVCANEGRIERVFLREPRRSRMDAHEREAVALMRERGVEVVVAEVFGS